MEETEETEERYEVEQAINTTQEQNLETEPFADDDPSFIYSAEHAPDSGAKPYTVHVAELSFPARCSAPSFRWSTHRQVDPKCHPWICQPLPWGNRQKGKRR